MDFTETTIDTREIYKGRIIHIKEDTVRLPNGEIAGRELVLHNGGVAVVAIDKDNNVLMVRQYRKPYEEMAQDVSDFIGDLPIVAHNAPFDVKFVAAAMSLIGREYSTPAVDTVGLAKLAHPNLVNYKLNTLIRHLSLTDHEQTHRAMDDVLCTKKLFDNCRRIICANNSVHAQKKTVDKALESVESAKTAVDVFLAYGNAEATLSEAMAMDPDSTEIVFGDVGKFLTKNFSPAIHNVLTKEFEKEKKAIQKLKTRKAIVSRIERFQNVYNANADKMTGPQKTKLKNYVSDLMKVCDMVAPR